MTRAEEIADDLAAKIIAGEIAPGERLPSEQRLTEAYGASRTVIREAVHRLQSQGLVHTKVGSGSYALAPPAPRADDAGWLSASGSDERAELHEFRIALEAESAALAARRATSRQRAAIARALERLGDASRPADTVEADIAFHRAVAEAGANRYLLEAIDRLGPRAIVLPPSRLTDAHRAATAAMLAEHRAVLTAIEAQDAVGANAAMRAHLLASAARREHDD
jgi:GntR family transcriptional repressor for pyruvate dehydrogenase complex